MLKILAIAALLILAGCIVAPGPYYHPGCYGCGFYHPYYHYPIYHHWR